MRSIKQINQMLDQIEDELTQLKDKKEKLILKRIKLNSKRKFKFPCGLSVPYNEITLIEKYSWSRGLGYADDDCEFTSYEFHHPKAKMNVYFYNEKDYIKYGIPYEVIDNYGRPHSRQINHGLGTREFKAKFKEVVKMDKGYGYDY